MIYEEKYHLQTSLNGKYTLVTGASRGIGRSIAKEFARAGARVALHYHQNKNAALNLQNEIGDEHPLVQADLSDSKAIEKGVNDLAQVFPRIDVLVNNAGVFWEKEINQHSYKDWQQKWNQTIQTNLMGPVNLTFLISALMKKQGGGKIINVTSRGAFRGEPKAPDYGASKAALNSFSQSMALALAKDNIFVYAVAPGWVETDMAKSLLDSDQAQSIISQSPLDRIASPEEIARTILFLAADQTEYLTGCIIDINGASYLRS
ncbi:SDR family oxidoreductase [candidate division KSB1 bacterium]|nr:SDR family oxidoreductase [candidate division KSB1 bacterium]